MDRALHRRQLLNGAVLAGGGLALAKAPPGVSGDDIALTIHRMVMSIDGHQMHEVGVNGLMSAPLIQLKRGQNVRLAITNNLNEDGWDARHQFSRHQAWRHVRLRVAHA